MGAPGEAAGPAAASGDLDRAKDGETVSETVAVLVASGNPAYAAGLAAFLGAHPFVPVIAHTVDRALGLAVERSPALAVIDWELGDAPGSELAAELAERSPATRVLFCVPNGNPEVQIDAVASGAAGVILPTWTAEAVLEAVADALRGARRFDVEVVRSLSDLAGKTQPRRVLLTDQERVVLRLMRQQLTYKEIALHLGISWHTVRSHAQSILRKLGVHSRRDLDAWDARMGSAVRVPAGAPR
jgi:two-component system nitrate/nitrite response regulator NarL